MTIDDADLIRLLDGELTPDEAAALDAAVRSDPEAAARLEALRRRSSALSTLLTGVNPAEAETRASAAAIRPRVASGSPAGDRGTVGPRTSAGRRTPLFFRGPAAMRIAAAIAVLLGVALLVPPARAWMAEGARSVGEALGLVSPEPAPPVLEEGAAAAVDFPAAGDTFEVRVPAGRGTLLLRRSEGALGSAEGARYLVLPGALRIEEPAGGVYRVALPVTVRVVRVRVGQGEPMSYELPEGGEELRIELAR